MIRNHAAISISIGLAARCCKSTRLLVPEKNEVEFSNALQVTFDGKTFEMKHDKHFVIGSSLRLGDQFNCSLAPYPRYPSVSPYLFRRISFGVGISVGIDLNCVEAVSGCLNCSLCNSSSPFIMACTAFTAIRSFRSELVEVRVGGRLILNEAWPSKRLTGCVDLREERQHETTFFYTFFQSLAAICCLSRYSTETLLLH